MRRLVEAQLRAARQRDRRPNAPVLAFDLRAADAARSECRNSRLEVLAQEDDLAELIKIIHKPGWTTPAEFMLVHGVVETIGKQVEVIEVLKRNLVEGSRQIAAEGVHTTV